MLDTCAGLTWVRVLDTCAGLTWVRVLDEGGDAGVHAVLHRQPGVREALGHEALKEGDVQVMALAALHGQRVVLHLRPAHTHTARPSSSARGHDRGPQAAVPKALACA